MDKMNCVLLVDDDKINNLINEKLIKKLGLSDKVKTCYNGEEALLYLTKHGSCFDTNYPDLILLDWKMPEMQGDEFVEFFNKINSFNKTKSRIVVLTGVDNPEIKKKLLDMGVDDYLVKPLTAEKLQRILKKCECTEE